MAAGRRVKLVPEAQLQDRSDLLALRTMGTTDLIVLTRADGLQYHLQIKIFSRPKVKIFITARQTTIIKLQFAKN